LLGLVFGFIASVVAVQVLGLKAYSALLWLPILVLCVRYVLPLAASLVSQLKVEPNPSAKGGNSYKNTLRVFLSAWVSLVLVAVVYGFFNGRLAFLFGSSRRDVLDVVGIWSLPLVWVNPSFVITPEKSLAEVLGILTANSYFNALALTVIFKVVHGFMRRSRVTQLGISSTVLEDDDEL